ncbi:MAG: hypothetical protein J6D28_00735 [Bacilli bacterium]|nr:hypothetical protein [Bacilli bacterium]
MDREKEKIKLIDNIMSYFRYQLIDEVEEHNNKLPTFNIVLQIMIMMKKDGKSYSLVDIDNRLFDKLIIEVSKQLFIYKKSSYER